MAEDVFDIVGTTQAGNFHVQQVVAEGGFAVVYRALHGGFRAPVALKCLKIPEAMTKRERETFLEKFREEGELMFRLSAAIPEVVRPLQIDVLTLPDGRLVPFIALEWLEGETLDSFIAKREAAKKPPLGLAPAVKLLGPMARALARAHRFPGPTGPVAIVHRDLKPENVFVIDHAGDQSVKILDYGIAKAKRLASQASGRLTGRVTDEDDFTAFSPAYGSPEQWSPKKFGETGPWTDVWGFALTLVELVTGRPAIDGELMEMRATALDAKRRPTPRALGAAVPPEVDEVFAHALTIDPRQRFQNVEAFWAELEETMGLPVSLEFRSQKSDPPRSGIAGTPRVDKRTMPMDLERAAPIALPRVNPSNTVLASFDDVGPGSRRRAPTPGSYAASEPAPARRPPSGKSTPSDPPTALVPTSARKAGPGGEPGRAAQEAPGGSGGPARRISGAGEVEIARPLELGGDRAQAASLPAGLDRVGTEDSLRPAPKSGPSRPAPPLGSGSLRPPTGTEASIPPGPASELPLGIDLDLIPEKLESFHPPPRVSTFRRPQDGLLLDDDLPRAPDLFDASLKDRLRAPVLLLVFSALLTATDLVAWRVNGEHLMVGPVQPLWVAGPLAFLGAVLLIWRLL